MLNSKCAEVFCQSFESFAIICIDCNFKTHTFNEFVFHYQEIHCNWQPTIENEASAQENYVSPNRSDIKESESKESTIENALKNIKTENCMFENECEIEVKTLSDPVDDAPQQVLVQQNPLESPQFSCPNCGKEYHNGNSLRKHLLRCDPDYKLPRLNAASECIDKTYSSLKALHRHKRVKLDTGVEQVDEQTKEFEINVGIQKTTEKFSTKNVQTNNLDIESVNCDFEDDLNENALSGSDNDETLLQITLKESSQETSLTISCPKCDRKYYNKRSLQMHLRRHHPGFKMLRPNAANSSTTCADCPGKTYRSLKALQRHRREKHSTETANTFPCPNCEKQFQTRDRVTAHLRCVHKKRKNTRRYSCTQCERVFTERYQLRRHEVRHTGVRNFICPVTGCGQAFYDVKALGAHRRLVHVDAKKFVCDICGFSTKTSQSLKTHIRTHTAEKPYKCDQCDKWFATTSAVIEHKVIHNSHIRPHICDVCGKSFARPKALYHHKPLHLGIKKFICKICGKAYAQQAGLSAHKRQHTLENFGDSL